MRGTVTPGGPATVNWGEDDEYEVHAEVGEHDAGVTWALPENCYPPEGGEVEITEVRKNGVPVDKDAFWEALPQEEQARLERALFEAVKRTPDYDDCGGDMDD